MHLRFQIETFPDKVLKYGLNKSDYHNDMITSRAANENAHEFELRDLSLWYQTKDVLALDRISLTVSNEHINIILGQNGSGKSSLLRCLAGIQYWSEGDILRRGVSRKFDAKGFNEDLILISEDISLPFFPLGDLAKIYSKVWPSFDNEVFKRVIGFGEISVKKRSFQLSRGQKILAQFALGLATKCRTVLVDEVTAALDPYIRRRVANELVEYQKNHSAVVVLATNIATEFDDTESRVVLLKNGKIYLEGLLSDIRKEFVKAKFSSANLPSGFVILWKAADGTIAIGRRGGPIHGLEINVPNITMEEIFIFLSERGGGS